MSIVKHTAPITVQVVTIESSQPIADVVARLDKELNKTASPEVLRLFQGGIRDEIVNKITETLGDGDFL